MSLAEARYLSPDEALALRLREAVASEALGPAGPALNAALDALVGGTFAEAEDQARAATAADPRNVAAWRLLAMALEGQGEIAPALEAAQTAHALAPNSPDALADLGRLALGLGEPAAAVQLLGQAWSMESGPLAGALAVLLAQALREGGDHDGAIEVLQTALTGNDDNGALWCELGAVKLHQGQIEAAYGLFDKAAQIAPGRLEPLYRRACARLDLGDAAGAEADCVAALALARPEQAAAVRFTLAHARLSQGDLARGWADYEARLDPDFPKAPVFDLSLPRWRPGEPLEGRRLLAVGEQGLGDELMLAGLIPDLIADLGPRGALSLAVEPRLVSLFQRSFPQARVLAHATGKAKGRTVREVPNLAGADELWTPFGALAQSLRPDLESFRDKVAALRPDPQRLAAWRETLAALGDGPKVGVTWKSMNLAGERAKQYAPFEAWRQVLAVPGVRFVNLQYGDSAAEVEQARAWGVELWTPPLDLTNDMEGLAALTATLDMVLGVANATTNLAAACGAPVWLLASPSAWPRLGVVGHYPWFADARVFAAARFGAWEAPATAMAEAMSARFGA